PRRCTTTRATRTRAGCARRRRGCSWADRPTIRARRASALVTAVHSRPASSRRRHRMRARTGAVAATLAVAVALGTGLPAWSAGHPPEHGAGGRGPGGGTGPGSAAPGPSSATVTLITGDQVTVGRAADGTRSVTVRPAAGREGVSFRR